MIYAYIRVSTDKQTVENQKLEIQKFATEKALVIDKWVSETVSGAKAAATTRMTEFTELNIGKRFGFVLDGEIITSELIEKKDEEGRFTITCNKKAKAKSAYESLLIGK